MDRDVAQCPRCGKPHEKLKFKPLGKAQGAFNYWAQCPEFKEPVMATVTIVVEGDVAAGEGATP
jgi:hypothetical protein